VIAFLPALSEFAEDTEKIAKLLSGARCEVIDELDGLRNECRELNKKLSEARNTVFSFILKLKWIYDCKLFFRMSFQKITIHLVGK
jgi:hypothetical protein